MQIGKAPIRKGLTSHQAAMFPAEGSEMIDNSTAHENRSVYWPWCPAAAALAGITVFIFATYGPPASSSGFVSALKGMWLTVNPEYAEGKAHYYMIADPGSGRSSATTSNQSNRTICSGSALSATMKIHLTHRMQAPAHLSFQEKHG